LDHFKHYRSHFHPLCSTLPPERSRVTGRVLPPSTSILSFSKTSWPRLDFLQSDGFFLPSEARIDSTPAVRPPSEKLVRLRTSTQLICSILSSKRSRAVCRICPCSSVFLAEMTAASGTQRRPKSACFFSQALATFAFFGVAFL